MRVLSLAEKFNRGVLVDKKAEAQRFAVNEKTIQRDLEDLRLFFAELYPDDYTIAIDYVREQKGYRLHREGHQWLTSEEILVIAKVLLESRAFPPKEMDGLLEKLILQAAPEERAHIKQVVLNERFHYISVKHGRSLLKAMWDLSWAVREKRKVELQYQKANTLDLIHRTVEPHGIIFSEYYFYLVAYISGKNYEYPAIYRLDRIHGYEILDERFKVPYTKCFEEGEFRKRVQFMRPGPILRIRFRFWGPSLEAALDRLPTARVIETEPGGAAVIEAEVYGPGIIMWLLSQGQFLEVLYPESLRGEMKRIINEMKSIY